MGGRGRDGRDIGGVGEAVSLFAVSLYTVFLYTVDVRCPISETWRGAERIVISSVGLLSCGLVCNRDTGNVCQTDGTSRV